MRCLLFLVPALMLVACQGEPEPDVALAVQAVDSECAPEAALRGEPEPTDPSGILPSAGEIGTDPPVYGPAPPFQGSVSVAFDGTNYLAAWWDGRIGPRLNQQHYDLFAARLSPSGALMDPASLPLRLRSGDWVDSPPGLAFGGGRYLISWPEQGQLLAARLSKAGAVLDATPIPVSGGLTDGPSRIAYDGTNFLVVWPTFDGDGGHIYGRRVSRAGRVLDAAPIRIVDAPFLGAGLHVAYGGARYLVAYHADTGSGLSAYAVRLCPSGRVLPSVQVSEAGASALVVGLATDRQSFLLSWVRDNTHLQAARVRSSGQVDRPVLDIGEAQSLNVTLGYEGNYKIIWSRYDDGAGTPTLTRVSRAGVVLDGPGVPLGQRYEPVPDAVSCHTGQCLLAYGGSPVQGRLLSGSTLQGPQLLSSAANEQRGPVLASIAGDYLVAWQDQRLPTGPDVRGQRVTAAGGLPDPAGLGLSQGARYERNPVLAPLGSGYLLVWEDNRNDRYGDIYAARLGPDGRLLDPQGFAVASKSTDESAPQVACRGSECLVVWQEQRSGYYDIYGARVTSAGRVVNPDGIAISQGALYQLAPSVAWDGARYLVAWLDFRLGSFYRPYAARVTATGTVLEREGLQVSAARADGVAVACGGGACLLAWDYEGYGVQGRRLNSAGRVLDPADLILSARWPSQGVSAFFDGTRYQVLWSDGRDGVSYDVYGTRVDPGTGAVQVADGALLFGGPGDEFEPRGAPGLSGQMLLAYRSFIGPPFSVARVQMRLLSSP